MKLSINILKKLSDYDLKVNLEIGRETLGFLGASGSGKSMTLRCIAGLVTPDMGRIVLNDRVLFDSERGINVPVQERHVGLLFQNYALFPNLTVRENIAFGLRNLPKSVQDVKVREKMEMLGLSRLQERYPRQISGGEQQRTALARTLVTDPECLLLDEPFSALDNHIRSQLERELTTTLATYQGTVIFVTHNLKECYRMSKKIAIIDKGQMVSYGNRDQVFISPQTVQAARLTGCKNISRFEQLPSGKVKALDWGCSLAIERDQLRRESATHLGIREHQLNLVEDGKLSNTFPCWLEQITETPFTVNLTLRLTEEKRSDNRPVQLLLPKEEFEKIKNKPLPWNIHFRPECFFLLRN